MNSFNFSRLTTSDKQTLSGGGSKKVLHRPDLVVSEPKKGKALAINLDKELVKELYTQDGHPIMTMVVNAYEEQGLHVPSWTNLGKWVECNAWQLPVSEAARELGIGLNSLKVYISKFNKVLGDATDIYLGLRDGNIVTRQSDEEIVRVKNTFDRHLAATEASAIKLDRLIRTSKVTGTFDNNPLLQGEVGSIARRLAAKRQLRLTGGS